LRRPSTRPAQRKEQKKSKLPFSLFRNENAQLIPD